MSAIPPLPPDGLYPPDEIERLGFATRAELEDLADGVGQLRAVDAAQFGIGMRHAGPGSGKRHLIRNLLDHRAADEPTPADWCYVHNFAEPHKPRVIEPPAGPGLTGEQGVLIRQANVAHLMLRRRYAKQSLHGIEGDKDDDRGR